MNRTLSTSRLRTFFIATAMMAAMIAGIAMGITAVSAQVLGPDSSLTICHATASQNNPYTTPPVNVSGVLGSDNPGNAHDSHELDIIPPFQYDIGEGVQQYPGKNWDANGQAIWNNGCQIPPPPPPPPLLPAVLVNALFINTTCDTDPAVIMPPDGNGVTYSLDTPAVPGVTVTVTATLNTQTHMWGVTAGWLPNPPGNATQLTQSFTFADPDCRETAVLGHPLFFDATCENDPAIIMPPDGGGVTYALDTPAAPGVTVTVTATLNTETHIWGETAGWLPNPPGDATQLTQSYTFSDPDCREPAQLGAFLFIDATCDGGPVLLLPANGNGVTYSQNVPAAPGVTVTVTATLNTETHVWGDTSGWLPDPPGDATELTRTFSFTGDACPTPTETETPTGTVTPSPTTPATETPTATATETPTATTPAIKTPAKEPVTKLPNTGSGDTSSPVGTVLIVAALGVAAVGGAALVIGDRKRA